MRRQFLLSALIALFGLSAQAALPDPRCLARYENAKAALKDQNPRLAENIVSELIREAYAPAISALVQEVKHIDRGNLVAQLESNLNPEDYLTYAYIDRHWTHPHYSIQRNLDAIKTNAQNALQRQVIPYVVGERHSHLQIFPYQSKSPLQKSFFYLLPIPVTAYGQDFSVRLAATARVMIDAIERMDFKPFMHFENYPVITENTGRAQDRGLADTIAQRALVEGVLTLIQSITFLMPFPQEGFTRDSLLKQILADPAHGGQGMINKLALLTPPAVIGPAALTGRYYDFNGPPLVSSASGKLAFAPTLRQHLADDRLATVLAYRMANGHLNSASQSKAVAPTGQLHSGCPVAHCGQGTRTTPLQSLANTFWETYLLIPNN